MYIVQTKKGKLQNYFLFFKLDSWLLVRGPFFTLFSYFIDKLCYYLSLEEILKKSKIQCGIISVTVNVLQTPLPFYATKINHPFLNSMISTNHKNGLKFQPIFKPFYHLNNFLVQNLFSLFMAITKYTDPLVDFLWTLCTPKVFQSEAEHH